MYKQKRMSEKMHILKEYIFNNWSDHESFSERLQKAKNVANLCIDLKKEYPFNNKDIEL